MSFKTITGFHSLFTLMSRERCIKNLKKYPIPTPKNTPTINTAVLIPICRVNNVASLLYIVRSVNLPNNCGRITFPGGKTNQTDMAVETALKKTEEDIGLSPSKIDIWGHGPAFAGVDSDVTITPVIGAVADFKQTDLRLNTKEVSEVFTLPVSLLCNPKVQFYTQFRYGFVLPVFIADEYKIWGTTAYLTHAFLSCLLTKDMYSNEWSSKKVILKDEVTENQ